MSKQIKIGDENVTIEAFRTYKAFLAGAILARITTKAPEIADEMAAYTQKYEKDNFVEIDRATATWRYADEVAHIPNEAWESSGNKLTLRQSPSFNEQIAHVFPSIFAVAQDEVMELLALLVTTNRELRQADEEGEAALSTCLDKNKKVLMHDADLAQLLELAVASIEVIKEQFKGKEKELGKLRALWTATEETESEEEEATETNGKPESSIASLVPMGGPEAKSSSESPGPPSETSESE